MDLNMVKYLAELSKLEYSDKELAATAEQMTDIIDLMDTVKEIDITYDDLKDNHDVYLRRGHRIYAYFKGPFKCSEYKQLLCSA